MTTNRILGTGIGLLMGVIAAGSALFALYRDGNGQLPTSATSEPGTPTAYATATPEPISAKFEPCDDCTLAGVGWEPGAKPVSPFPIWRVGEAVIYDTRKMAAIDLGEGGSVVFSDDGMYAAWLAGPLELSTSAFPGFVSRGTARILTLATGERRDIGPASGVVFVAGERIAVAAPRTPYEDVQWTLYDTVTLLHSADQTTPGQPSEVLSTVSGHRLKHTPTTGTELPRGGYGSGNFQLLDPLDNHVVMTFDAFAVADAGVEHLVVARSLGDFPKSPFESIPVQIYLLDLTTGAATWIGAAAASAPNWNLTATERYVLWTNNFCSQSPHHPEVVLLDRASKTVRGFSGDSQNPLQAGSGDAWMLLTPSGLIAQGTFGATSLLDPQTGRYVVTLPPVELAERSAGGIQARWSKDYRYATYYLAGGHGGLC